MSFQEKDKALQDEIISLLIERLTINVNKEAGVAYFSPDHEDRVNPSVIITAQEIKERTGRDKLRDAVINDYQKALSRPGVLVERSDGGLSLTVMPTRKPSNNFSSLRELAKKNRAEIAAEPDLAEPYF